LEKRVLVDIPTQEGRRALLNNHLKFPETIHFQTSNEEQEEEEEGILVDGTVNVEELVTLTEGFTNADLVVVCHVDSF